MEFSLIH
ncbi:hypothetical protein Pint_28685 [Pistacia integerrima]|nr:hypothetical protein Pint_28685 [Pistacia integerrima]